MKNRLCTTPLAILLGISTFLWGCQTSPLIKNPNAAESLAICQDNKNVLELKENITKQFGFRKIAADTYKPVTDFRVFGHAVRVIDLNKKRNRLYVSGTPREFAHHIKLLTTSSSCETKDFCEAIINDKQTVKIYRTENKKLKNTSILECNYSLDTKN